MGLRETAIAGLAVLAAVVTSGNAWSEALVVKGRAQIVDGMTLEIWGKRIQLAGIVQAEPDSREGRTAKDYLEKLISGVAVRCETSGERDRKGTPGRCFVGNVDIAASLVKAGHARRIVQQSSGR